MKLQDNKRRTVAKQNADAASGQPEKKVARGARAHAPQRQERRFHRSHPHNHEDSHTIDNVKARSRTRKALSPDQQPLILASKQLEDDRPVSKPQRPECRAREMTRRSLSRHRLPGEQLKCARHCRTTTCSDERLDRGCAKSSRGEATAMTEKHGASR